MTMNEWSDRQMRCQSSEEFSEDVVEFTRSVGEKK
jgi:hypothetical protein